MSLGQWILLIAILVSCVLLILVILVQRGRGEGLAGAFGGGGSSAFGAKTGDVFTAITVAFACVFFLLNVFGNYILRVEEDGSTSAVQRAPTPGPPVSPPPTPVPVAPPPGGAPASGTVRQLPAPTPALPLGGSPSTPKSESGVETGTGDTKPAQGSDAEETS